MKINFKRSLVLICLLFITAAVAAVVRSEKRLAVLTRENHKLHIQKDSLLAEKLIYEKKFMNLLQQFDTIEKKKSIDNTVIFIPKNKRKGQLITVKKSEIFN